MNWYTRLKVGNFKIISVESNSGESMKSNIMTVELYMLLEVLSNNSSFSRTSVETYSLIVGEHIVPNSKDIFSGYDVTVLESEDKTFPLVYDNSISTNDGVWKAYKAGIKVDVQFLCNKEQNMFKLRYGSLMNIENNPTLLCNNHRV